MHLAADLCSRLNNKYYEFSAENLSAAVTTVKHETALVYEDIIHFEKDKETLQPILNLTLTLFLIFTLTLTNYMSL